MRHLNFSFRFSLLAIIALCLFIPAKAQYFYHGGLAYRMTDENTAEVSYAYGDISGAIEIPSIIDAMVQPEYEEPYELTVTITGIGSYSLYGCTELTDITLPSTLTYIGYYAFYRCNSLQQITCQAVNPPTVDGSNSFYSYNFDIYSTATLRVPKNSVTAYSNANVWKLFTNITAIGDDSTGDVDGNGVVNISDVTALIDLLLSGAAEANATADVDGNGIVNIADVTALIDILLQKN